MYNGTTLKWDQVEKGFCIDKVINLFPGLRVTGPLSFHFLILEVIRVAKKTQ